KVGMEAQKSKDQSNEKAAVCHIGYRANGVLSQQPETGGQTTNANRRARCFLPLPIGWGEGWGEGRRDPAVKRRDQKNRRRVPGDTVRMHQCRRIRKHSVIQPVSERRYWPPQS